MAAPPQQQYVHVLTEHLRDRGITDLVVWGLRSNRHTHHYIHRGIYRAFTALALRGRFRVHWHDDAAREISRIDRRRRHLIFASPHYDFDRHLPLLEDSYYLLHADWSRSWPTSTPITRYRESVAAGRTVFWKVFRGVPGGATVLDSDRLAFYEAPQARLTMPWATDLVPREIERSIRWVRRAFAAKRLFSGSEALFIGSVWKRNRDVIAEFEEACRQVGLSFLVERIHPVRRAVSATRRAFMAPAVQGADHMRTTQEFYVPCRIFKNVSYGALGVTNNLGVDRLLDGTAVFHANASSLVKSYRTLVAGFDKSSLERMISAMELVRDRHTYLDRLTTALAVYS